LISEDVARAQISQVSAQVLTNRQPAYSLVGGLYEALMDTNGEMYAVDNEASERARALFEELEGIDIGPAAGVATAALMQAVSAGQIGKQECILLNITSGGFKRIQQDHELHYLDPSMVFAPHEITLERVLERMKQSLKFSA
jgi:cysteate synthase